MSAVTRFSTRSLRAFVGPSLILATALFLAVFSAVAKSGGQFYASAFLALVSLVLAAISSAVLVPRLLVRLKLDFLNHLQFFRFTPRGAFFVLIVLVLAFSALNTGNNLLILVLSFLLASFVVSGVISNLVLHRLKIVLNLPEAIHAGQRAVFFLTLRNLKRLFPSFALTLRGRNKDLEDDSGATNFFVQEKSFPYIRAGEEFSLNLNCEFRRRGIYSIEGFEVKTTFPFGFFARGRKLEAEGNILVYPEISDLGALFQRYPHLRGSREKLFKGMGGGLYSIRPYQSGDTTRAIHWKSSAKLGSLMVKDFSAEEESPLFILFSTCLPAPSEQQLTQFERAVSWIASLAAFYWSIQQSFGFYSGDFEIRVGNRQEDYEALMEYLSCTQPSDQQLELAQVPPNAVLFTAGRSPLTQAIPTVNYLEV